MGPSHSLRGGDWRVELSGFSAATECDFVCPSPAYNGDIDRVSHLALHKPLLSDAKHLMFWGSICDVFNLPVVTSRCWPWFEMSNVIEISPNPHYIIPFPIKT